MSWGYGPWGETPWGGTGGTQSTLTGNPRVMAVNIWATDLVEIVFSGQMLNNATLKDPASYAILGIDDGALPVEIKSIRSGRSAVTNRVFLVITAPTVGLCYEMSVIGDVRSTKNLPLTGVVGRRVRARETKVDRMVRTRPGMYDTRPESNFRQLLNVLGYIDDTIGGNIVACDDVVEINQVTPSECPTITVQSVLFNGDVAGESSPGPDFCGDSDSTPQIVITLSHPIDATTATNANIILTMVYGAQNVPLINFVVSGGGNVIECEFGIPVVTGEEYQLSVTSGLVDSNECPTTPAEWFATAIECGS